MLAAAIRERAKPLAAAQNAYKQNVVMVNTLMTSVLTSNLPVLHETPPDWADFEQALESAKSGALDWVNNVMARLLSVPDTVRDYDAIVRQLLESADTQAAALVADPTDTAAREILIRNLDDLLSEITLVRSFVEGALGEVRKFKDTLPGLAQNLETISEKAARDAKADEEKIQKLQQDIDRLHRDIDSLTSAIIALGIVDGIAITIGLVATIALWPVGAAVWFVLAPAVVVATTFIALDAKEIEADKAQIAADQKIISGLTADVSALHILAQNFQQMSDKATALETNLAQILAEWQKLEDDVKAAVGDIQAAITDTHKPDYRAVEADLAAARQEWNAAMTQAGALHLDLNVNPAQLQLGMSASEVQAALGKQEAVPLIAYYNQVAAA